MTLDEIAANDYNLNIPRCVELRTAQAVLTIDEAINLLRQSARAAFSVEENLIAILNREEFLA